METMTSETGDAAHGVSAPGNGATCGLSEGSPQWSR